MFQFGSPTIDEAATLAGRIVETLSEPIPVRNAIVVIGASVGLRARSQPRVRGLSISYETLISQLYAAKERAEGDTWFMTRA